MNNFEKLKNMTKEELAEFLNSFIYKPIDDVEPFKWFDEKYCSICPDIEVINDGKKKMWKECYFEGNCPHQDYGLGLIKLWLEGE